MITFVFLEIIINIYNIIEFIQIEQLLPFEIVRISYIDKNEVLAKSVQNENEICLQSPWDASDVSVRDIILWYWFKFSELLKRKKAIFYYKVFNL